MVTWFGYQTRLGPLKRHGRNELWRTSTTGITSLQFDYTGSVQVASHFSPIGLVAINRAFDTGSRIHS